MNTIGKYEYDKRYKLAKSREKGIENDAKNNAHKILGKNRKHEARNKVLNTK